MILEKLKKNISLLCIGGILYFFIEILWRGYSSPYMMLVGGLCFVIMGLINELFTWEMHIELQALIATIIVLVVEFFSGYILNILCHLNIWDYSNLPCNLMGQISLYFAFLWFPLCIVGIILDDYLRYYLFSEEKPHYRSKVLSLFKKK